MIIENIPLVPTSTRGLYPIIITWYIYHGVCYVIVKSMENKYQCIPLKFDVIMPRVEISHIRDSNLIGQLIRSCLRQGCGNADFDNKRR